MTDLDSPAEPAVYTVVLGIANARLSSILKGQVDRHEQFSVVNSAPNAVLTVDLAARLTPDVIVLSDQSPGIPGRQVIDDLVAYSPDSLIIMTTGGDAKALAAIPDVAHAVHSDDTEAMQRALDSTAALLLGGETDLSVERRSSMERRVSQDWTKVFSERRVLVRRAGEVMSDRINNGLGSASGARPEPQHRL